MVLSLLYVVASVELNEKRKIKMVNTKIKGGNTIGKPLNPSFKKNPEPGRC